MAEYTKRYNPQRSAEWNYGGANWKLSRSKIDFFLECPRCFWVDNVHGTKRPGFPSFNLNIAVDELFKKEFDSYRAAQEPHPLMLSYGIEAVPLQHPQLDTWRDPFVGISYKHTATGLVVSGGVDDIWVTPDETLIVVDYKATSKEGSITTLGDSPWEQQYARQLSIYRWLLEQNNFSVSPTSFLVYANADKSLDTFDDHLEFETTLIPVTTTTDWIEPTLHEIKLCLEQKTIPPVGTTCEYCPYRDAVGKKLLAIHRAQQVT
jgi:CRISPR/Cas system-associated exonuclease Cas4 (RecB family)